jgi:hypothetical protein
MVFTFDAKQVAKLLRHSLAADEHEQTYDERLAGRQAKAGLHLVGDMGIYLMSNGIPGLPLDPAQDTSEQFYRRLTVHSGEIGEDKPAGGLDIRRKRLGTGDDFVVYLPATWFDLDKLGQAESVRIQVAKGLGRVGFCGYK